MLCSPQNRASPAFGKAADGRTGKTSPPHDQAKRRNSQRRLWRADKGEVAIAAQQIEVGIDVVIGGDSVEDKIEASACFSISSAFRETTISSAPRRSASSVLSGEVVNTTTWAPSAWANFTPMCPRPPKTDDADLLAFADAPMVHGRIGRDSGTKQRCGPQGQIRRNAQNESLIDNDALGIAAVGDASKMFIGEVVGQRQVWAELFQARPASGHVPSESTMQPTAARSPVLNFDTAEPTLVTRPTIS